VEFHLLESASYYFDNLDRISQPNYRPNNDDILRARRLTVDAEGTISLPFSSFRQLFIFSVEFEFEIDGYTFHIIDVGGQKGEREKWINYFQNNDAVIFFVAMSEYDQKLYEDDTTNRMLESLKVIRPAYLSFNLILSDNGEWSMDLNFAFQLFSDVSNHQWFANAAIILFLNKSDVFREKIKHVPISVAFPDYAVRASVLCFLSLFCLSRFVLSSLLLFPLRSCFCPFFSYSFPSSLCPASSATSHSLP
jgi:GTPase SAR1 family protein